MFSLGTLCFLYCHLGWIFTLCRKSLENSEGFNGVNIVLFLDEEKLIHIDYYSCAVLDPLYESSDLFLAMAGSPSAPLSIFEWFSIVKNTIYRTILDRRLFLLSFSVCVHKCFS